ncbi:hypothetical protein G5C51_15305 [Streptomyces sp. A7024]|uniref:Uncharacterized protein n=1 Tax=Streptomyces coryli TaxID=1128680 RepID=A0A6G4U1Z7_9ACTN|nr:hypothetical protein [Streptomyces coryli]NGN65261.1 hypothetical protein [Streptomyces coryli]
MPKSTAPRRHLPNSPFKAKATPRIEDFVVGDRVCHDQYGLGRIVAAEYDIALHVDFGDRQLRITSPYARMHKL